MYHDRPAGHLRKVVFNIGYFDFSYFSFFLAAPCGLQDLSSPIRIKRAPSTMKAES